MECIVGTMPICSMYGIFTYIWVIFRGNVRKYSSTMEHMGWLRMAKIKSKIIQPKHLKIPSDSVL